MSPVLGLSLQLMLLIYLPDVSTSHSYDIYKLSVAGSLRRCRTAIKGRPGEVFITVHVFFVCVDTISEQKNVCYSCTYSLHNSSLNFVDKFKLENKAALC